MNLPSSRRKTALTILIFITSMPAGAANPGIVDETYERMAVGLVAGLPGTFKNFQPRIEPCPESTGTPMEKPKGKAPKADVGIYECEFRNDGFDVETAKANAPAGNGPSPSPKPRYRPFARVPGQQSIAIFTDNDNFMLGAIPSGNDMGYTFGGGVRYDLNGAGIEVNTQLYTVEPKPDAVGVAQITERASRALTEGIPLIVKNSDGVLEPVLPTGISVSDGTQDHEFLQQFLNVNQIKVYKEWDRKNYFLKGAIALESRQITGKSIGVSTQRGWHDLLGIYEWKSIGADGRPAEVVSTTKINDAPSSEGMKRLNVVSGVARNEELKKFGSWAATWSGGVGKRVELFQGKCELLSMVSADLVIQGGENGIHLDPNSKIEVQAEAKASLLKNKKWNDSRLNLSTGGSLMYFPDRVDTSAAVARGSAQVEQLSHLGGSGNLLGIAFQVSTPGGRGLYQKVDDRDPVMRIAVRYLFGGKQKP